MSFLFEAWRGAWKERKLLTGQQGGWRLPWGVSQGPEQVPGGEPRTRTEVCALRSSVFWPSARPLAERPLSHAKDTLIPLSSAATWCAGALARTLHGLRPGVWQGVAACSWDRPAASALACPLVATPWRRACRVPKSPGPLWWRGSQGKVSPLMRWVVFQRLGTFRHRLSR